MPIDSPHTGRYIYASNIQIQEDRTMATYKCDLCGMSVNATCGECDAPLVNAMLKLDDGSEVQVSECPNGHGKIKSPLCCGQDMACTAWFIFLYWGSSSFLLFCSNWFVFFALYGQVTFTLLAQRKVTKRKGTRMLAHNKKTIMGSLRCSIEPAGCETRYRSNSTSRNPRLDLHFSASLNGIFKINAEHQKQNRW